MPTPSLQGILPSILAALMSARTRTRDALKRLPGEDAAARAVLDSRQKALKVMANALYGFTGGLGPGPLRDWCMRGRHMRSMGGCARRVRREGHTARWPGLG